MKFFTFKYSLNLKTFNLIPHQKIFFRFRDATMVTKLRPKWFKGYQRKAQALSSDGHHQQALENYQQALKFDPENTNLKGYIQLKE